MKAAGSVWAVSWSLVLLAARARCAGPDIALTLGHNPPHHHHQPPRQTAAQCFHRQPAQNETQSIMGRIRRFYGSLLEI